MRVSGGLVEVTFHNELHGLHVQGRVDGRGRRERDGRQDKLVPDGSRI